MAVKFADAIVKEIQERGSIKIPGGYVTGEAFEDWLLHRGKIFIELSGITGIGGEDTIMPSSVGLNFFPEYYGEAA